MTLQQMLDMMEVYHYEIGEGGREVRPAKYLPMLNQAQMRLLDMLNFGVLTDLDATQTGISLNSTTGAFALTDLDNTPHRGHNGIKYLKLTGSDYKFCRRITFDQYVDFVDRDDLDEFPEREPVYYVWGSNIYVNPYDGYTVDAWYRQAVTDMELDEDTSDDDTSCALDDDYHEIIVGLALEDYVDYAPAIKRFVERTYSRIAEINKTAQVTDDTRFPGMRTFESTTSRWDFMLS